MKKYIALFIFLTSIVNFLYSFDRNNVEVETGDFYFLTGTEGNERVVMYLHILGTNAYGSYYTESQSIGDDGFNTGGFSGSFDGKKLNLVYGGEWDENINKMINQKYITGTLSGDIVFRGKHNSKNVNLSLANAPINNMKIFNYRYGDDIIGWDDTTIIHPKIYSEKKLINYYNSEVEGYEEYSEYGIDHSGSQSITYIDDKIIIFYGSSYGYYGGAGSAGGQSYIAYSIDAVEDYFMANFDTASRSLLKNISQYLTTGIGFDSNEVRISDFIANPKDRRLLSLIRNKYKECFDTNFSYDDFENFEDVINGDIDVEYLDFSISPEGTITIYDSYMNHKYGMVNGYLWATFTFEELKPFIKKGSVLEYLFN